jgi:hypothetical protein
MSKMPEQVKVLRWVLQKIRAHAEYGNQQWEVWKKSTYQEPDRSKSEAYWEGHLDALRNVREDINKKLEAQARAMLTRDEVLDLMFGKLDKTKEPINHDSEQS